MKEDIFGNLYTIKDDLKHNRLKIAYHINLRKSEKNIKELAISRFSS